MFTVFNESYDEVIRSVYLTVMADYAFALDNLVPLIDKLDFQRSPLRKTFYSRLERDIIDGCIMPFLTIAINKDIKGKKFYTNNNQNELEDLLKTAFVLDGIQRLNTLSRVANKPGFDSSRPIFFNILICGSMDRLLYRMVTLNNGQRPMTARHQIEILAQNMLDFSNIPLDTITEKQSKSDINRNEAGSQVAKDTLIKSYIAYISHSVNIDNQKIIESKMDELIRTISWILISRLAMYSFLISFILLENAWGTVFFKHGFLFLII